MQRAVLHALVTISIYCVGCVGSSDVFFTDKETVTTWELLYLSFTAWTAASGESAVIVPY